MDKHLALPVKIQDAQSVFFLWPTFPEEIIRKYILKLLGIHKLSDMS